MLKKGMAVSKNACAWYMHAQAALSPLPIVYTGPVYLHVACIRTLIFQGPWQSAAEVMLIRTYYVGLGAVSSGIQKS